VLSLVSLVAYVALLIGTVRIGSVSFDVHTLFLAQAGLVVGFSTIALGMVVRLFAMREGLLGDHVLLDKIRRSPTLELGGLLGLLMLVGGVALGVHLLRRWQDLQFGPLRYGQLLRSVSLSATLLTFGGLTVLFSLIFGFLALPTRNERLD
jgi:hypothetical protein